MIDCCNSVVFFIIGLFLIHKLHAYRYLRPFKGLLVLAFLAYRFNHSDVDSKNILIHLSELIDELSSKLSKPLGLVTNDFLGLLLLGTIIDIFNEITNWNPRGLFKAVTDWGFNLVKDFSFVKNILSKEQDKLEASFDKELKVKSRAFGEINTKLPETGIPTQEIVSLMKSATKTEDTVWENGRVSGAIYFGKHDHIKFLNECFGYYSIANPLHPDIWPSVMKYESEIIAMTASLVNNGLTTVCGSTTSGGTESIILAIKAHRDYYRLHHNITKPEMIVGTSAHAAVDKACDLMNIKLIKIDLDPITYRINLNSLKNAIGPNTIMMYASSPSYPHGAIDPIAEMSQLAIQYNIGLHVDCCLGGFILPFAKKLGYIIPEFTFALPGVTSMSLDTHKYGYALKGTSVVLYRTKELRHAQYFCYADWTGGMYTTPTIAGSRSGGMIAQTWASMMSLGMKGYMQHTDDIMKVTRLIAAGVKTISGIKLFGETDAMIVCFGSADDKQLNIYSIGDKMHGKGWSLNALQNPPCIHLCCTATHVNRANEFLKDLREAVEEVRSNPGDKSGNAAIYGMASSLPPGPVNELLKVYNDVVLKC